MPRLDCPSVSAETENLDQNLKVYVLPDPLKAALAQQTDFSTFEVGFRGLVRFGIYVFLDLEFSLLS